MPRLRQAVLAATELEPVASRLRDELDLGEPFSDPAVEYFGLLNAVFALGDTFLEVVSPARERTAAGRWLSRRGGDCGYMVMFEIEDLNAARERAARQQAREVFEVDLDDMAEVHLHPADMRGAIVAISEPHPPGSWRWGGPKWKERSAPGHLQGVQIEIKDPETVEAKWGDILDAEPQEIGVKFASDTAEQGLTSITIATPNPKSPTTIGGVLFTFEPTPDA